MIVEFVEFLANTFAHDANLTLLTIVLDAIFEHKVNIVEEFSELKILVIVQLILYRPEVHRLLNNLKVIRNVQFFGVYGVMEDPGLVMFPQ